MCVNSTESSCVQKTVESEEHEERQDEHNTEVLSNRVCSPISSLREDTDRAVTSQKFCYSKSYSKTSVIRHCTPSERSSEKKKKLSLNHQTESTKHFEPRALCPGSHTSYTAIQKTITCIPTSLSFTIYPGGTTAIIQTLDYSNLPGGMMAVHKSLSSSTLPGSEVNSYTVNRNKLPVPCNKKERIGRMKRRNG